MTRLLAALLFLSATSAAAQTLRRPAGDAR